MAPLVSGLVVSLPWLGSLAGDLWIPEAWQKKKKEKKRRKKALLSQGHNFAHTYDVRKVHMAIREAFKVTEISPYFDFIKI